jgi:hypothetical protein
VLSIALSLTVVTGCIASDTTPPAPTAASPDPTSSPAPPAGPVLVADGSASDNLPLFTSVTAAVWASEARESGRAYIDALVAAGFDKASMQVTEDLSTVGNPAESIQFSVRWQEECLIGQIGPATGDPVAVVVPVLAEGMCLIGQTRPIDW